VGEPTICVEAVPGHRGRTITTVPILQVGAGYTILSHEVAGKTIALHKLYGHMSAAGTAGIYSDHDGAGTGETVMVGDMDVAATGTVRMDFGADADFCPQTDAAHHMTLKSAVGLFKGVAVVSYVA